MGFTTVASASCSTTGSSVRIHDGPVERSQADTLFPICLRSRAGLRGAHPFRGGEENRKETRVYPVTYP
ncbi:hypothetical protein IWX88_001701 [Frigoribacterium sp. CG_9.8]|nr:hypothetical protein [Frigoribacterium sp. CG_9.8]